MCWRAQRSEPGSTPAGVLSPSGLRTTSAEASIGSVRADPERVVETHTCLPGGLPFINCVPTLAPLPARGRFETTFLPARHSIAWMGFRLPRAPGCHLLASATE